MHIAKTWICCINHYNIVCFWQQNDIVQSKLLRCNFVVWWTYQLPYLFTYLSDNVVYLSDVLCKRDQVYLYSEYYGKPLAYLCLYTLCTPAYTYIYCYIHTFTFYMYLHKIPREIYNSFSFATLTVFRNGAQGSIVSLSRHYIS